MHDLGSFTKIPMEEECFKEKYPIMVANWLKRTKKEFKSVQETKLLISFNWVSQPFALEPI